MDPDSDEEPKIELVEPINRSDLLNGNGVEFCVSNRLNRDDALMDQPEDVFNPDELLSHVNLETLNIDENSVASTPFENIKLKMTKVTPDGYVMKRVKRQGVGDVIAPHSVVTIHYNGYFELNEVPFDSSSLRGRALTFTLGGGFLPGLDIGVSTMRKRERAEFILHPSVAYGKIGCPPRIPPNVEVLFDVELLNSRIGAEADVLRAITQEERTSWECVHKAVRALVSEGAQLFKNNRISDAKIRFGKAKDLLTGCHLKNEEEENIQKKALLKVCSNLAMVYNKLQDHESYAPRAIINCKEGLAIDPHYSQLHLQWGRALTTLGDYAVARQHLLKAKAAYPTAPDVIQAFEQLEGKIKREKHDEQAMWGGIFGSKKSSKETEAEDTGGESSEDQSLVEAFEAFKKDTNRQKLTFPAGLIQNEQRNILNLAKKMNLNAVVQDKVIIVSK